MNRMLMIFSTALKNVIYTKEKRGQGRCVGGALPLA